MIKEHKEVLETLKKHAKSDATYKSFREKCTNLNVIGLRIPVIHQLDKEGFSFFVKSDTEILHIWNTIWHEAKTHEVMLMALYYYTNRKQKLDLKHWNVMKQWVQRIENWEHADTLCAIYSRLLEQFPKHVEPTLRTWNRSKNPWLQRASIVSTIYYASPNRKAPPLDLVFALVEPLIPHQDPYVQKAVGWQLREAYKLDSKRGLAFIQKHVTELAPTSYSYATEWVPKDVRAKLKEQRRNARALKKG